MSSSVRDFAELAGLYADVYPWAFENEAAIRHWHESEPARAQRRMWVAEEDGRIVGRGVGGLHVYAGSDDVAFVRAVVHPAHRGRGLGGGSTTWPRRTCSALGARRLLAEATDDDGARGVRRARGFAHTMTRQALGPRPARRRPGASSSGCGAETAADGFELLAVRAFANRPELIHAVDDEASRDEPARRADRRAAVRRLARASTGRSPMTSQEGSFAVVRDGAAGGARASCSSTPRRGRATNGFTGTLRAYRGRGLARLAKLASIAWLREQGVDL